jgi:putative ABC transport system substrate-binding protein
MRDKIFLAVFCLLFLAGSVVFAQQKTIICVKNSNLKPYEEALNGFKDALARDGIEFKLITYDLDGAEPAEFEKADLIFTLGTTPTKTVSERTKRIPVVFTMVPNPSFAGPNITGVLIETPFSEQFDILSKIKPRPKTIGILYDPGRSQKIVELCEAEARLKGFAVKTKQIYSVDEVYGALRSLRPSIDSLIIIPDITVYTVKSTEDILLYCLREGIPVIGLSPNYVKAGALFSFSANFRQLGEKSGSVGARLLRGEKASDIPFVKADKFDLSINLIVAHRINVEISEKLINEAVNVYK